MKAGTLVSLAGKGLILLLFAAAFWWRVDALDRVPGIDADEAYDGVILTKLLHGVPARPFSLSGNLLDPFFLGLELPFVLAFRPSPWLLRAPAAISGILAVVLAYVLGSRMLGRSTALIASTVLATLPIAVVYSRVGHEYSQVPLAGVIVLYFALRPSIPGLIAALVASFFVHPITVFVAPVALPVLVVRLAQKNGGDPARLRTLLLRFCAAAAVGGVVLGALLIRHPLVQQRLAARSPLSWVTFAKALEKFLLFEYVIGSESTLRLHRWLFWGAVVVAADLGVRRLVRDRQWERLAMAAGLLVSLTAFHVISGPKLLLDPGPNRYGVVFVVPIAVTFACFAQSLFVRPGGVEVAPRLAFVRLALLLAAGWGMLYSVKAHYLDGLAGSNASVWAIRTAGKEPWGNALTTILRDARALAGGGKVKDCEIIGQEFWDSEPLAFLASSRPGVRVNTLLSDDDIRRNYAGDKVFEQRQRDVAASIRRGAYVVTHLGRPYHMGGQVVEAAVSHEFAPGGVHRWIVPGANAGAFLAVYRLEYPAPATARGKAPTSRR